LAPVITENIQEEKKNRNNVVLRAYSDQKELDNTGIENERIIQFLPMVHKIVRKVIIYLKPPLSFEDMVSAGTVGLVRAARDFDPSHGAEFKTYAYIRIKGAILDELRGWSFIPANLNKRISEAQRLSWNITKETGVTPTDDELAEKLGIDVDELLEMFENARSRHFLSLEGSGENSPGLGNFLVADDTKAPDKQIERQELLLKMAEAIQQLPQNLRQIILLYYQQHLTMKQIAEVLELTESRVSQLHASALFNLSVKLRKWKDGGL
jgi:RNA polymerase sigma factor for flagellar operon FliA